jgi:hypothetical protein
VKSFLSAQNDETSRPRGEAIFFPREDRLKRRLGIKGRWIKQWGSIMWHIIFSWFYRNACRSYVAAARSQRNHRWA